MVIDVTFDTASLIKCISLSESWRPKVAPTGVDPLSGTSRTRVPYKINDVLSDECAGVADDQWSSLRGAVK